MIYLCFAVIIVHIWWLERLIKKHRDERIEREKVFNKWMFDSFYSLNNKVLLPEEHEKPTINKKAKVYSPNKDPLREFTEGFDEI